MKLVRQDHLASEVMCPILAFLVVRLSLLLLPVALEKEVELRRKCGSMVSSTLERASETL